jgi:UDP-N-acetylmuramoyl-L-alanyl-D-glutamate--2,6-diaminopimelate ligase
MHDSSPPTPRRNHQFRELCARSGVRAVGGKPVPDIPISMLTDDSRQVIPGACFVAVRGAGHNGHDFIPQARERGAAMIVTDHDAPLYLQEANAVLVRVSDSREALARLAAAYYGVNQGGPNALRLVGITGTNGKSTVAWLMRSIVQASGQRVAMFGTIEYDLAGQRQKSSLTTPGALAVAQLLADGRQAGANFAVMEVSSHALDQRRCDGLVFDTAVFTNLSGDHLDYHKTMEAYFQAKRRLFELTDEASTAVINRDDPAGARLGESLGNNVVTFGIDATDSAISARIQRLHRTGSVISVQEPGGHWECHLKLTGRHNVSNALAAVAAARSLRFDTETIRQGLEQVRGVPGRLQRVEPDGCPFSVVVDYAHTDAALENGLNALRPLTPARLICVFGCGGDRDRTKRPRMAAVAERIADVIYVTSDNPRTEDPRAIIADMLAGFTHSNQPNLHIEVDRRHAIALAIETARPGDTVLIAGKGHEDYQIMGDRVLHFDDAEVARELLHGLFVPEAVA